VDIPKSGKSDYYMAYVYRDSALQICLGKVIEKVLATKIMDQCETKQLLHNGQFGCRKRMLEIDVVGRMVQKV
jgi:hypothetical protein